MATPEKENPKTKRGVTEPGKRNDKYHTDEVKKFIAKRRDRGESWKTIAKETNKGFGFTMTDITTKKIFEEAMAEGLIHSKKMGRVFSKYADQMDDRYGKACKMVDWLVDSIERVKEEFESQDLDDLQKYIRFIKLAPTVIATSREILNQLDFIRKEQERIKISQKNLIYSPIQINQFIHKFLKDYVKEGKIKILKNIPEINALAMNRIKKTKKEESKENGTKETDETDE